MDKNERARPMLNPPHLGEMVRESMEDVGWNVTETAALLGCGRGTLLRLLNGRVGMSAKMALALKGIGWGTTEQWMRMEASHELARARRRQRARSSGEGRARSRGGSPRESVRR